MQNAYEKALQRQANMQAQRNLEARSKGWAHDQEQMDNQHETAVKQIQHSIQSNSETAANIETALE